MMTDPTAERYAELADNCAERAEKQAREALKWGHYDQALKWETRAEAYRHIARLIRKSPPS